MFKNKYYVVLAILALVTILIRPLFSQVGKEVSKQEMQYTAERSRVLNQLKQKGDDSAIKSAEDYLVDNPNDIDTLNLLTEVYINQENLSKAIETAKKAVAVQSNNPGSRRLLAKSYRIKSQKEPEPASDNLRLALEQANIGLGSNRNDVELLVEEALIYAALGEIAKANEAIDLAITINPGNASLKKHKENINSQGEKKKTEK